MMVTGEQLLMSFMDLIETNKENHNIHNQPSYDSQIVQSIPVGTYTIVEERTDSDGNAWGKLKTGLGWICLTEMQG